MYSFLRIVLLTTVTSTLLLSHATAETQFLLNAQIEDRSDELTEAVFRKSDPREIGFLYQILKVMDIEFKKNKIPYWIDFGTLLGAVRHGGIIPWDDDADVCLMVNDKAKVAKLASKFKKYGLILDQREPLPWKLHRPGQPHFCVDLFFVSKVNDPDKTLTFYSDWTGHWYENEVSSLVRVPFGPIKLNAPALYERRLLDQYGSEYMEKAVYYNHIYGLIPYKVRIVDFSPAEYTVNPSEQIISLK